MKGQNWALLVLILCCTLPKSVLAAEELSTNSIVAIACVLGFVSIILVLAAVCFCIRSKREKHNIKIKEKMILTSTTPDNGRYDSGHLLFSQVQVEPGFVQPSPSTARSTFVTSNSKASKYYTHSSPTPSPTFGQAYTIYTEPPYTYSRSPSRPRSEPPVIVPQKAYVYRPKPATVYRSPPSGPKSPTVVYPRAPAPYVKAPKVVYRRPPQPILQPVQRIYTAPPSRPRQYIRTIYTEQRNPNQNLSLYRPKVLQADFEPYHSATIPEKTHSWHESGNRAMESSYAKSADWLKKSYEEKVETLDLQEDNYELDQRPSNIVLTEKADDEVRAKSSLHAKTTNNEDVVIIDYIEHLGTRHDPVTIISDTSHPPMPQEISALDFLEGEYSDSSSGSEDLHHRRQRRKGEGSLNRLPRRYKKRKE